MKVSSILVAGHKKALLYCLLSATISDSKYTKNGTKRKMAEIYFLNTCQASRDIFGEPKKDILINHEENSNIKHVSNHTHAIPRDTLI